ncbi:MAG: hypothetical protein ACIAXF_04795 [Phycisphaerales bacterium JB063]
MTPPLTQDAALQRARSYWLAALFIVVPLPFVILPLTGAAWLNAAPGDAFEGGTRFTLMSFLFAGALAMLGMFARNQAYKSHWQGDIVTPAGYARGNLYFFAGIILGAVGIALAGVRVAYPAPSFAAAPVYFGLLLLSRPNGKPMHPHPPAVRGDDDAKDQP